MRFVKSTIISSTLISTLTFTAQAEINVVASVKPVHSLVSGVMDGVGKPALIVKGSASPHTYSLKPSQAQQIEEADLVFWMGHELESFLEKPLEAIATKAKVVELIDSDELKKLDMREGGAFDDHGHDEHGHDEHGKDEHDDDHKDTINTLTKSTMNMMNMMNMLQKIMMRMVIKTMMNTQKTNMMNMLMSHMMNTIMVSSTSMYGWIRKMRKYWLRKSKKH